MRSFLRRIPGVKFIHRAVTYPRSWHHFSTDGYGTMWGVYGSFSEAKAAAPRTKEFDYDNPVLAREYADQIRVGSWERGGGLIRPFDYPAMFWIKSWMQSCAEDKALPPRILDFGGSVGVHFYAYAKYLSYPAALSWIVCDLPCIVSEGRSLAAERAASQLRFVTDIRDAGEVDLFFASGSLQAIAEVSDLLAALPKLPRVIILNRLPLYDGPRFVTLQNGGPVFYCQHVFNRVEFLGSLDRLGYSVRDEWVDTVDSCWIPYYPERSFAHCTGLYLELKGT